MSSYLIEFPEGQIFVDASLESIEAIVEQYYSKVVNRYNDNKEAHVNRMDTDDLFDTLNQVGGVYGACRVFELSEVIDAIKGRDDASDEEKEQIISDLLSGVGEKDVDSEFIHDVLLEINDIEL